jgi:hypothetical protein
MPSACESPTHLNVQDTLLGLTARQLLRLAVCASVAAGSSTCGSGEVNRPVRHRDTVRHVGQTGRTTDAVTEPR